MGMQRAALRSIEGWCLDFKNAPMVHFSYTRFGLICDLHQFFLYAFCFVFAELEERFYKQHMSLRTVICGVFQLWWYHSGYGDSVWEKNSFWFLDHQFGLR